MGKSKKTQQKPRGRRPNLPPELEVELANRYRNGETAAELVEVYAPLSRTGKLSMSSVIMISQRVAARSRKKKTPTPKSEGENSPQEGKSRLKQLDDTSPDAAGSGDSH